MTTRMGRVTCDITISADGCSAGLNQSEERPFGDDGGDGWGDKPHAWFAETPDENRAEIDQMTAAKTFIMGRTMFGPVRGEWDRQWSSCSPTTRASRSRWTAAPRTTSSPNRVGTGTGTRLFEGVQPLTLEQVTSRAATRSRT